MKRDKSKYTKTYKKIGNNVRSIRKKVKLSQEELAFRVDSARNYIGCIERGEKIPSVTILMDIATALNCNIKDLFHDI